LPDEEVHGMTRWRSQYIYLTLAAIFFGIAVVSTFAGKTLTRSGGGLYRAKDPSDFWWSVAFYYIFALFLFYMYLSDGR
jgi:hypothetical protein